MHPPLCIVGLRRRSHDLRSGCLKNAEGVPAYYPNGWDERAPVTLSRVDGF